MIKSLLFLLLLFLSNTLLSQTINEVKADPDLYLWGEGAGSTLKKADDEALMMLISQISTRVEGSFEMTQTENDKNFKEKVQSVVKTYSAATIKNTIRIILSDEPEAKVFRYIKRSEIALIFEERKNKILSFVNFGNNALKELQISDALKYFYWSLTLLRSHPDGSKIVTQEGFLMSVWLTDQINSIFKNLSAEIVELIKDNGFTTLVLNITYKKSPVSNFDFSYFDGGNFSSICSAKDGLASAELAGNQREVKTLKLKSEYIFENEANFDSELKEVLQKFDPIPFRSHIITAYYTTNKPPVVKDADPAPVLQQTAPQTNKEQSQSITRVQTNKEQSQSITKVQPNLEQSQSITSLQTNKESLFTEVSDKTYFEKSITEIKKAVTSGQYNDVKLLFTPQGFDFFQKLVQYGRAKILRDQPLTYVQQGKEVLCRSIPMSFSFKNNNKQFVEDLVIRFDSTQKINELSFSLGQKAIADIMSKSIWAETVKVQMVDFLESYKTAYALKRLDYIEKIFSDDALIIVGSYINVKTGEPNPYRNNKILKYNRVTKQQYIKNLQMAFRSNEFINLKFEDNEVRKSGKGGEVYGIQIRQNFNSTNYSDFGYLFLMIDFNNPNAPTIHVRTWQPEKDPNGLIYGLNDFN